MQSSSLCDLFLTLYTCLAARDQTGTELYWQKCSYQAKEKDSSSNPSSTPQIMSAALVSAFGLPSTRLTGTPCSNSTWWTKRNWDNQAGSALREGSKLGRSYWNLQVPICNMQRRQSWVLLRGKEQMQLHGKFFLCCWEVFTLCGENGFSKERYRTTARWNPRSPNPSVAGKHFSFHPAFWHSLTH